MTASRQVPALRDGEIKAWDTLGICEYLAGPLQRIAQDQRLMRERDSGSRRALALIQPGQFAELDVESLPILRAVYPAGRQLSGRHARFWMSAGTRRSGALRDRQ